MKNFDIIMLPFIVAALAALNIFNRRVKLVLMLVVLALVVNSAALILLAITPLIN